MDRVLEAPKTAKPKASPGKEDFRLLFPGEKSWESWIFFTGKPPLLRATLPGPAITSRTKFPHLAIPLREVIVFPLWLSTTDPSLMREMVSLQLESRGLGKAAVDATFEYRLVKQEQERSLLAVYVLPESFPAELSQAQISGYRPATDYWELPGSHLLVWKELGHMVWGLTSGPNLVYIQNSPGESLPDSAVYEMHCARLLLEGDGSIPVLHGIVLYGTFSKEETSALQSLHLPTQHLERPPISKPKGPGNLLPATVLHSRQELSQKAKKKTMLFAGGGIYLALLLLLIGQILWLGWQRDQMNREIENSRPEVAAIRETFNKWRALELAILPETYPVEILYRCIDLLPPEGVRFLDYDQSQTHVLIGGEAKNALTALQYVEALKKNPELGDFEWEMPAPTLLPNESAQFRIEGKRRDATAQNK